MLRRFVPALRCALAVSLVSGTWASPCAGQERGRRAPRPLVEPVPSVVNRASPSGAEEPAPKPGRARRPGLERAPGRSLEDLRRELERFEAGERAGDGASASSSHTRRVVVENGRVVLDEETRDGRPVTPAPRGRTDASAVAPRLLPDAEAMLRQLDRELRRGRPAPGEGAHITRSHTRRIVVVNGETIVDEETVDGEPVRRGAQPAPRAGAPAPRAEARASASSSHSRRQVVRDGKVVVDEETVDGRPVIGGARPGAKAEGLDARLRERLRQVEQDLVRDLERQGAGDAAREVSRELQRARGEAPAPQRGTTPGGSRERGGRR